MSSDRDPISPQVSAGARRDGALDGTRAPRIGVFVTILAFVTAVVMLTGTVITASNYLQARRGAETAAQSTLNAVVARLSEQVASFFATADLLVDLYSKNVRVTDGGRDVEPMMSAIFEALRRAPQLAGIYAGYENGDFWEIFSFSEREAPLLERISAPPGTRFALQTIRNNDGVRTESWRYFDLEENELGTRTGPAGAYDPRARAWYIEARATPDSLIRTDPYVFNSASRTGITIARSFKGLAEGVVSVDVTLDRLSSFLSSAQPNPRHRVLLLDREGRLVAAPETSEALVARPARIFDVDDAVVQAVAKRFQSAGAFPIAPMDVAGEIYLASVGRLPISGYDSEILILNAAPRSDFEGSLAGAASRSVISALIVLLLASPAIVYFARKISRPIVDLADNARLIQAIMDTMPNPVFYMGPDATYTGCNHAYEKSFGTRREEIVGKRLADREHLPADVRAKFQAENEEVIAKAETRRYETPLIYVDGKQREVLYHVTGFEKEDGTPGGLVGTLVDITELKEAEHAMERAKELAESATKAKSEFLASMSHEIRTPLNGVTGMADLLAQTELDADQKHMLRTIRESGNALLRVINDILDFSKIEAGKLAIEAISMSVADALEGVAVTLAPAAAGKGVRIHTFVDPAIPEPLSGDPVRLRQILFNLVGNAVKFSNGQDIAVRARCLAQEKSSDGAMCRLRFEIIDRGIGISAEDQAKLFQAFSQAESSTTRRFGGTGLGLAICRRLTDLMGGAIGVTSRVGEGSTFFVELPFGVTPGGTRSKVSDLGGLRVLLLGCPEERRAAIETYLGHWNALTESASDEAEAFECIAAAARGVPFDCILLDFDFDRERQANLGRKIRADGAAPRLILLDDLHGSGVRLKDKETVTVDANPLVRHRIVSAVAVACGRESPEIKTEEEETALAAVAPPTVDEAAARGQLILLAEDNPTNQDVIRRQLARLGYACEIVGNGTLALAAWKTGRYAVILTDCHMPDMDGYQLAGAIRKVEDGEPVITEKGARRTPIIAITANALQGEAERCLAAGMDDYLSKPVNMRALRNTLHKWVPGARPAPASEQQPKTASAAKASPEPGAQPVDERIIKDMFGEDHAQYLEILESFVEPSHAIIVNIAEGRRERDAERVKDAAHQLKSSSRTIGAIALADVSVALETAAKNAQWESVDLLSARVEEEMRAVLGFIQSAPGR